MAHHSSARNLAGDSSPVWIAKVREATADQAERITIEAIDLGELGDWGYPTTYHHRHRFRDYVHSPWRHGSVKPDLLLIDGRFRVACFLHCLLAAEAGTPSSSMTTPTAPVTTWWRSSARSTRSKAARRCSACRRSWIGR